MFTGILVFILIGITLETAKDSLNTLGMARVTLGPLFNSISGSIGEIVNATWKGINYLRSKAKTISNPQSTDQMKIRARIAECAKYWYDTLTAGERNLWETYAGSLPSPSSGPGDIIKPGKGPWSGYTAFLRNNLYLFTAGISPLGSFLRAAPIGITPPDAPTTVTAAWADPLLNVGWVQGTIPGVRVRIWIRSINVGIHAQLRANEAVAAGLYAMDSVQAAKGKDIALADAPGKYDIQVDVIDAKGQPSPPSLLLTGVNVT